MVSRILLEEEKEDVEKQKAQLDIKSLKWLKATTRSNTIEEAAEQALVDLEAGLGNGH